VAVASAEATTVASSTSWLATTLVEAWVVAGRAHAAPEGVKRNRHGKFWTVAFVLHQGSAHARQHTTREARAPRRRVTTGVLALMWQNTAAR
jgi:hypothetical protein